MPSRSGGIIFTRGIHKFSRCQEVTVTNTDKVTRAHDTLSLQGFQLCNRNCTKLYRRQYITSTKLASVSNTVNNLTICSVKTVE